MTPHDLATLAWAHKEDIVLSILGLLGWSAHPPRWLVQLRRFPFARAASVLRWLAGALDWAAGEVSSKPSEAPSAPSGSTETVTPKETP